MPAPIAVRTRSCSLSSSGTRADLSYSQGYPSPATKAPGKKPRVEDYDDDIFEDEDAYDAEEKAILDAWENRESTLHLSRRCACP